MAVKCLLALLLFENQGAGDSENGVPWNGLQAPPGLVLVSAALGKNYQELGPLS